MPKRKLPKEHCYFAENLKRLRLNANLTQAYVAEQIGVERTTYTKWELGDSEPSFYCLSKLIELLNEVGNEKVDYNKMFGKPN